jgi:hypothetical protein
VCVVVIALGNPRLDLLVNQPINRRYPMPLTLNVGLSKKTGQPDYGSLGASCHVVVELDGSLLQHDLDGFHQRARQAFTACRQAVNDELARHRGDGEKAACGATPNTANGHARSSGKGDVANGQRTASAAHRASGKQLTYLEQLSSQVRGLDAQRLEALARKMFGKPVAETTVTFSAG